MKIVTCMGYVYRLSERRYRQLLRQIATDQPWELDDSGAPIDSDNLTDMEAGEAADKLRALEADRTAARAKRQGVPHGR